jgi:hypothetical protein
MATFMKKLPVASCQFPVRGAFLLGTGNWYLIARPRGSVLSTHLSYIRPHLHSGELDPFMKKLPVASCRSAARSCWELATGI